MARAYLDRRRAGNDGRRWIWLVRYQDSAGRRLTESIGYWTIDPRDAWRPRPYAGRQLERLTERDAENRARQFDARMRAGQADRVEATDWDEWVDGVIERNRGTVAPTTLVDYERGLRQFGALTGCSSPRRVDRLAAKRFQQLAAGLVAAATVNKWLAALCRTWNSEFPHAENPFKACKSERAGGVRRMKVAETDWHRITSAELQALLGVLDARWKAVVLVGYTAGLRMNEIANLTWADIDLTQMTIKVAPKEDTPATWAWTPKDHERRTLPLTAETKLSLLRLGRTACPYVFVEGERYQRLLRDRKKLARDSGREVWNNHRRTWQAALKRAGVPKCEFHDLRRTCITNWLESGARGARVEPHEVRMLAGHSSIDTTMKYYTKVAREAVDRARKASSSFARFVG